jgi:hypothetical protein
MNYYENFLLLKNLNSLVRVCVVVDFHSHIYLIRVEILSLKRFINAHQRIIVKRRIMFESIIAYVLNKFLSGYIDEVDYNNLKLGLFSGTYWLSRISLDDCLS